MQSLLNVEANRYRRQACAVLFALSLCLSACATNPPPETAGPRAGEPPYPILLTDSDERRQATLAAWSRLTSEQGITSAPAPELQPVTGTLRSIRPLGNVSLYLPKVGDGIKMDENEMRESLRRFIAGAGPSLCGERQQLSLVLRTDGANGVQQARYSQRPFRYPLRGGYGELEISFMPDRRILEIRSTCIPNVEQLQRAFIGVSQSSLTAPQVSEKLQGRSLTFTDASGNTDTKTISQPGDATAQEFVIYPVVRAGEPAALELHLAWEVFVGGDSRRLVYVDARTGEVLGTELRAS